MSSQVAKTSARAVSKSFLGAEVGTDRQARADDFDGRGFCENGWPSAFSATDGLDKPEQGCEEKRAPSHSEQASLHGSFQLGMKETSVLCIWCVCARGRTGAGVECVSLCACACIILLVCLYDCEHKKCTASRIWPAGLCDDGTIKVSTVNTPV